MEILTASDYMVVKTLKSLYDPEATIRVPVAIKCPRCKTLLNLIEHGEKTTCGKCGLHLQVWGNALEVWE